MAALSERGERRTRHAADAPLGHHRGTRALVEADRVHVPVEHAPFEAPVAALDREAAEPLEQRAADAARAPRRLDVQVLEIEAGLGEEGREIGEEEREGDDRAAL